jgi:hypothetical protein
MTEKSNCSSQELGFTDLVSVIFLYMTQSNSKVCNEFMVYIVPILKTFLVELVREFNDDSLLELAFRCIVIPLMFPSKHHITQFRVHRRPFPSAIEW